MHVETVQSRKERRTAILSQQKYEDDVDKQLRRKATVMNMTTLRNLVVITDTSFVNKMAYLRCKEQIIKQMTELQHLAHGVSCTNNDYLRHKLQAFKIFVIQFRACVMKNDVEN
jgi:hypothetical protein